jgi:hypothetical protein
LAWRRRSPNPSRRRTPSRRRLRKKAKKSPFGTESRLESLRAHLDETGPYEPATAWKFVYQELLWFDGSIGLAHLYEADKAQPGRSSWYDRTVRFTDSLQERFVASDRTSLKAKLDRLFRDCLEKLLKAKEEAKQKGEALELEELEESEGGEGMGDVEAYVPDADLVAEFSKALQEISKLDDDEAIALARNMVAKARHYFTVERKRQNILGEGFEDLLSLLANKVSGVTQEHIRLRKKANTLPGFAAEHKRERIESPDIAFVSGDKTDALVSVKWSIRHDRQKQWADELDCYVELISQVDAPTFLLITNEFDPGRIVNAFSLDRGKLKLDTIYHVSLELLELALNDHPTWDAVKALIDAGRLKSLRDFFEELNAAYGK